MDVPLDYFRALFQLAALAMRVAVKEYWCEDVKFTDDLKQDMNITKPGHCFTSTASKNWKHVPVHMITIRHRASLAYTVWYFKYLHLRI